MRRGKRKGPDPLRLTTYVCLDLISPPPNFGNNHMIVTKIGMQTDKVNKKL